MQPQNYAISHTPTDTNTGGQAPGGAPGEWFWINATVAGNVSVDLWNGDSSDPLIFRVELGQSILALSVARVNSTGTTATASYISTRAG